MPPRGHLNNMPNGKLSLFSHLTVYNLKFLANLSNITQLEEACFRLTGQDDRCGGNFLQVAAKEAGLAPGAFKNLAADN